MKKLVWLFAVVFSGAPAVAQNLGTGAYAFASFDNPGFDSINLGNLNTRFSIPIVSRTGRGMPFSYTLQYEGLIWQPSSSSGSAAWTPDPSWGFNGAVNGNTITGYLTYRTRSRGCPRQGSHNAPPATDYFNYVYHDPFGGGHLFNYSITGACPLGNDDDQVNGDGSTSDNSGYSLVSGYQVRTRTGTMITPPTSSNAIASTSLTDTNGNSITSDGSGHYMDTLGVTALTISGSNPVTMTYPVTLQASSAATAHASISYSTYAIRTNFQCSAITEYSSSAVSLVSSVTLSDGSSTYSFTYEPTPGTTSGEVTGRLASITLPTGGTISYSYSGGCNGSGLNADGTVGSLTRTTSDGVRSYGRTPVNANATYTTLTDEKKNASVYQFTIDAGTSEFFETHRQVYQGNTSGPLLLDQYTCNNGASANCDGQSISLPITSQTVITSYNGGTQSVVTNTYSSGLLTSSAQPYGINTNISYNSLGEVTSSITKDGSGNTIASSTYGYDEASAKETSNIVQHTTPSASPGNQTSTTIYVDSSHTLSTTTTYYDTGAPIATTSPNGKTSYGYDSTQAFVTQTTFPTPASGVSLSTSASYDPQSAMPLSTTGMNSDQIQITQYDALLRPTSILLPSGSSLSYIYTGANLIDAAQTRGSGLPPADRKTLLDSYGRVSRQLIANGQSSNPWYQTDSCYDPTGLLQFVSTSYAGTGFNAAQVCSDAGTSYTYDGLGRVASSTTKDGTVNYTYNGRAVQTADVNGVKRISQYDLLGRLVGVCEISSNADVQGSSPGACGMDIPGTGFVTSYSYNPAAHSTTITQGVQTRTFVTDAVGRTTDVQEPERGETKYTYTYNATGLSIQRTRPKANQPSAATLTTTTTQYDTLGRLISTSYDDGLTPNRFFYYDSSPASLQWSTTPSNTKGRLAATLTGSSGVTTRSQLSYDLTGNVTNMWQCAPSICGTSNQGSRQLQFGYDLAGNLNYAVDEASGAISYGRSPAGEITSITNGTYTDSYNPPNLVSNVVNGPFGPTNYSLGNGTSAVLAYDNMGRSFGGWLCSGAGGQGSSAYCSGNTQMYGYTANRKGSQVTGMCDTVVNQCQGQTYDEFNRLTAVSGGSNHSNYTYSYDRYGNRWQQTSSPSGPNPNVSINTATNTITSITYDAAGNAVNDGIRHTYTYDAEGNILQVDQGGSTAQYLYDAMNHRVRSQTSSGTNEFLFDPFGRRASTWSVSNNSGTEGRIYWDNTLFANRSFNGQTYFHHVNWLGTERMRTNYQGQVANREVSLAFGDGFSQTNDPSGASQDNSQFAGQEYDAETNTDHAQFRQFSSDQGRWMSPDPYDGSMDLGNPQSFNRYAYVGNNPLSFTDPSGLQRNKSCDDTDTCPGGGGPGLINIHGSGYGNVNGFGVGWNEFTTLNSATVQYWGWVNKNGALIPDDPIGLPAGLDLLSAQQGLLNIRPVPLSAFPNYANVPAPSKGAAPDYRMLTPTSSSQARCESSLLGKALFAGMADSYNLLTIGWTDAAKLLPAAAPAAGVLTAAGAEGLGFTAAAAGTAGSLVSGVAEAGALVAGGYLVWNTVSTMSDYMSAHSCVGR